MERPWSHEHREHARLLRVRWLRNVPHIAPPMKPSGRVVGILAASVVLGIVLATTFPAREPDSDDQASTEGVGWLADRLCNLALFLPLGAVLASTKLRTLSAIGLGAGISATIETLQLGIPGRYPALADVVANVLGTALGFQLRRGSRRWLSGRRDAPRRARCWDRRRK